MNLNNDDDLKNKEDLYIAGRHAALDMDIFRFAAIFLIIPLYSEFFLHHPSYRVSYIVSVISYHIKYRISTDFILYHKS